MTATAEVTAASEVGTVRPLTSSLLHTCQALDCGLPAELGVRRVSGFQVACGADHAQTIARRDLHRSQVDGWTRIGG